MTITQTHSMKHLAFLLMASLLPFGIPLHAIDNPDFSEGKKGWTGSGTPGYLDANGEFSPTRSEGSVPVLRIELNRNLAKSLSQRVVAKSDQTGIALNLRAMASSDYKRKDDSKVFDDVKFEEGGQYVWSAPVHPRCDFLVRVNDSTYHYRPVSLRPIGQWKPLSISIADLEKRNREVELIFPPGEGSIYLQTGEN